MFDTEKLFQVTFCMARQCWEQALLAQAMLECGHTGKEFEYVVRNMIVRQNPDGRLCDVENTPAVVDSCFCIPAVMWLGEKYQESYYLDAAKRNFDYLKEEAARSEDGTLYHMLGSREIWADGIGYLPYVYALMGDPKAGIRQLYLILDKLYNPENGLYMQRLDEGTGEVLNGEWAIGEGWILTGLVRLYQELIRQYPGLYEEEKKKIQTTFTELLDRVLAYETEDHLFHDILPDTSTYKETESVIMVALAIYRAVQAGMLDAKYLERAELLRLAAEGKVDEDGLVQDCAGSPTFTCPGTSVEGQMHMAMMEQAYKEIQLERV